MASSGFVNLHNHSDYSILDGYSHPGEYLKQAAKLGQVACALTDHGNLYGVFEFVKTARDLSKSKNKKNQPQVPIYVKPIVGIEAYMAPENPDGARCHEPVFYSNDPDKRADDVSMNGAYTHLTMLAINDEGFHNLIKLSTESFKRENVYYNQRMDMSMLAKWNRGLVVTTGCPSGEIQTRFRLGQDKEAYEYAERMMELFPDRYYVEVMHHNMPPRELRDSRTHKAISAPTTIEDRVLPKLVKMAKDLHLPLLATNDAHYASPEDQVHQDEMLCIQTNSRGNTGGRVYMDNPTESSSEEYINEWRKKNGLGKDDKTPFRFSFSGNDYYLKTYDEMIKQFPPDEFPGAVSNTMEIADMVGDWWSEPDLDVKHEEELYENDVKAAAAGLELPSESTEADTIIPGMRTVRTVERGSIVLPHAGGGHTSIKAPAGKGVTWLGKTDTDNPGSFDVDSTVQELIDDKKIFLGPYDLSLTKGLRPVVDIPEGWTEAEWFQKKLNEGFVQRRLAVGDSPEILEESKRRLAVEYPVFEGNDFVQYMLVVQDYINWARENGVSVGVGRGCFLPGSRVTLRNGRRVKIEKIVPGDYVRTHDGTCHVVESRFYYNVVDDDCVTVELDDGTAIKSTADHMYFVEDKGFVKGEDLKPGCKLLGSNGVILDRRGQSDPLLTAKRDESMNVWTVVSVKPFKYTGRVYDLQVEGVHNYQVEGVTVHNSVGGSEVAYLMDISRTDPIRHDLLFERFLNPERLSPPDVDTDFKASVRNKVLQYAKDKYGYENVANIITFGTFKFKQAFRDVAKIYRMDNKEIDRISKMIPDAIDHEEPGINDLYDENSPFYPLAADFRDAIASGGEQWSKIQKSTAAIEGRVRQTGTHACGVIMCSEPISNYAPLCWNKSEKKAKENIWTDCMVQWVYQDLESLGLIKMDFLPLSTLDVVDSTIANIEAYNTQADTAAQAASKAGDAKLAEKYRDMRLPVPDFSSIEIDGMDDRETYKMLARGDSDAVFQLGSDGQKELLRKIAPDRFDDLVAINALYRPGPMNMNAHLEYADRKNGRKPSYVVNEALDPVLKGTPVEDVLKPTHGLIVFQEQVMQISQRLCGFTKGQADSLRKAMGHKIEAEMIANHDRFVDGAMKMKDEKGYKYSREDIEDLWKMVQEFSKYAFNKCCLYSTEVVLEDNSKITMRDLYKRWEAGERDLKIMSMWPDGTVRPNKIASVEKMPEKMETYEITVKHKGSYGETTRSIVITPNHRMLTTDGYHTIDDGGLHEGVMLIADPVWTSGAVIEDKATVMDNEPSANVDRTGVPQSQTSRSVSRWFEEKNYDTWAHSFDSVPIGSTIAEIMVGDYFLERGIDFEFHKTIPYTCDFYADGLYFEIDDLGKGEQWFKDHKYGDDIPFVYMTPGDYIDKIDAALTSCHVENGVEIVSIRPYHKSEVYDIEMDHSGPANFIANGLVSHNSHSVSYAINAYETAYLKCHYAPFFWAAILTQNIDDKEKFRRFLQNAIDNGLKVGPVDVNKSAIGITAAFKTRPDDPDITFGFDKVKGVNANVARELTLARRKNDGEFKDFHDFMEHAPKAMLSVSVLQSMAKAGAFDSLGVDRKPIVERAGKIIEFYSKRRASGLNTGGGLMGMLGGAAAKSFERYDLHGVDYDKKTRKTIKYDDTEYSFNEKLAEEKSVLGVYVSATPVSNLGAMLPYYSMRPEWWKATTLEELERQDAESKPQGQQDNDTAYGWRRKRKNVRLIGYLVDLEAKKMRSGDGYWYKAVFMDGTGSVPARIGANAATKILMTAGYSADEARKIKGTTVIREDVVFDVDANWEEGSISINDMAVVPLSNNGRIPLVISANTEKTLNGNAYRKMLGLFSKHPGDTPVVVDLRTLKNKEIDVTIAGKRIAPGPVNWLPNGVEVADDLLDQLAGVIPPDALVPWAVRGIAREKPGSPDYVDGE